MEQHHAWVNHYTCRYYAVRVTRNLFGDWTLRQVWGGIDSRRGGTRHTGLSSYEQCLDQVREIAKRRAQRGYQRVLAP
jgi:hypothetical protein